MKRASDLWSAGIRSPSRQPCRFPRPRPEVPALQVPRPHRQGARVPLASGALSARGRPWTTSWPGQTAVRRPAPGPPPRLGRALGSARLSALWSDPDGGEGNPVAERRGPGPGRPPGPLRPYPGELALRHRRPPAPAAGLLPRLLAGRTRGPDSSPPGGPARPGRPRRATCARKRAGAGCRTSGPITPSSRPPNPWTRQATATRCASSSRVPTPAKTQPHATGDGLSPAVCRRAPARPCAHPRVKRKLTEL